VIRTADAGAAPVKRASGALGTIETPGTPGVVDEGTGTAGVLLPYCVSKRVLVNVALSCSLLSVPLALWFPDSGRTSPVAPTESTAELEPEVELGVVAVADPVTDPAPVAELERELELGAEAPPTVQFSAAASEP
jgi:hypothetical protein